MTPSALVSPSNAVDSIVNGTIGFLRSRWLKWGATWPLWHVITLMPELTSHDANGIVNGTIAFVRPRWLKLGESWLFCIQKENNPSRFFKTEKFCIADTDGTNGFLIDLNGLRNHLHDFLGYATSFQWHHLIHYVNTIKIRCNLTFLSMSYHWHQHQKTTEISCQMTFRSCDTTGTSICIPWCQWYHQ